jgi:mono/diheme cytochrome c family protein
LASNRLRWTIAAGVLLCLFGGGVFFVLTEPAPLVSSDLPSHTADVERGKLLYTIGGCISCHKPPAEAKVENPTLPSGGKPLATPVGTLYPPNITPDPQTGIGKWSALDFINAVHLGISPQGRHYIPAFPYASYHRMPLQDVIDLQAYVSALPAVKSTQTAPATSLPSFVRRGIGLWKKLALSDVPFAPDAAQSPSWNLGAYLVNAPGHCGECHTPRNIFMVPDERRHLAGAPHPEGKDKVPSLRNLVGRGRYTDVDDLTSAMRFGEMMGYDRLSSGGMGDVQANLAKLPEDHVRAIAEYLVSLK